MIESECQIQILNAQQLVTIEDLATRNFSATLDVINLLLVIAPIASFCVKFKVLENRNIVLKGSRSSSSDKYSTWSTDSAFFSMNNLTEMARPLAKDKNGAFNSTLMAILLGRTVPDPMVAPRHYHLLLVYETSENI
jgi:hypothetical protein